MARAELGRDISMVGGSPRLPLMGPYCEFVRDRLGAGVCMGTGGVGWYCKWERVTFYANRRGKSWWVWLLGLNRVMVMCLSHSVLELKLGWTSPWTLLGLVRMGWT